MKLAGVGGQENLWRVGRLFRKWMLCVEIEIKF